MEAFVIRKLRLKNFKNFHDAELSLGPFSVLIGVNASGKSNLRDAFRFLHGIARGYTLAEIIGEKYGEGGELQWRGIRGGIREITCHQASSFTLEVEFDVNRATKPVVGNYLIEIEIHNQPRLLREKLIIGEQLIFEAELNRQAPYSLYVSFPLIGFMRYNISSVLQSDRPVVSLIRDEMDTLDLDSKESKPVLEAQTRVIAAFSTMRFLDFDLDALRLPSLPGQVVLGDRGENLSTVLQAIVEDPQRRLALMEWIRELTPMDAADFEFPIYADGKTLLTLVERNGQKISAYSASDGTLRFLAVMAALLGPKPAEFYFFEELENGIHPARLHLLIEMIEREVALRHFQIVATTHSPQLLRNLSPASLEDASIVYRLPDQPTARVQRVVDLPAGARQVVQQKDVARLYESGWFENTMSFLAKDAEA